MFSRLPIFGFIYPRFDLLIDQLRRIIHLIVLMTYFAKNKLIFCDYSTSIICIIPIQLCICITCHSTFPVFFAFFFVQTTSFDTVANEKDSAFANFKSSNVGLPPEEIPNSY